MFEVSRVILLCLISDLWLSFQSQRVSQRHFSNMHSHQFHDVIFGDLFPTVSNLPIWTENVLQKCTFPSSESFTSVDSLLLWKQTIWFGEFFFFNKYKFKLLNCFLQSSNVSQACYNQQWYYADIRYQRILLIMMVRAQKPASIQPPTFKPTSCELFKEILSMSYQFFCVLNTMLNGKIWTQSIGFKKLYVVI